MFSFCTIHKADEWLSGRCYTSTTFWSAGAKVWTAVIAGNTANWVHRTETQYQQFALMNGIARPQRSPSIRNDEQYRFFSSRISFCIFRAVGLAPTINDSIVVILFDRKCSIDSINSNSVAMLTGTSNKCQQWRASACVACRWWTTSRTTLIELNVLRP